MKPFVTNKNVSKGVVENRPRPLSKHTVDERNPAPVEMIDIPCVIFKVLYASFWCLAGFLNQSAVRMFRKKKWPTKNMLHPNPLDAVVPKTITVPHIALGNHFFNPLFWVVSLVGKVYFGYSPKITRLFQFFLRFFNLFPLWVVALWKMLAPTQPTNSPVAPTNGQADLS